MNQRKRIWIGIFLITGLATLNAQSKPKQGRTLDSRTSKKTEATRLAYMTTPFDPTQAKLGKDFAGHNIVDVFTSIKASPSLEEKSEFESTAAFESRRAAFSAQLLFGSVTPNDYLAFVPDERFSSPEFTYDADSQQMTVSLEGRREEFIMEKGNPTLDVLQIESVVMERRDYMGSNAFGATVKVHEVFFQDYGVAFRPDNWLFRSSEGYTRKFEYSIPMLPDEARAWKAEGKLLLVCKLESPWMHHSAHGHDPTIDDPNETLVDENDIQVVPTALWVFNGRSGDVVRKLTGSADEQQQQFEMKLKQSPVFLEVSGGSITLAKIAIDDGDEKLETLSGPKNTFRAKHKISFTLELPKSLSDLTFTLNGKPYTPTWTKDSTKIGSYESIHSATTVITAP